MKNSKPELINTIGGDLSSDKSQQLSARWALQYEPGSDVVTLNIQGLLQSVIDHDQEETAKAVINREGVDDLINWLTQVKATMSES